ncbi:MAG: hypothetical protein UY95_C0030G0006 [Parcubacteria group bacterium GW2011_GWA2_56_7]|nr:MAG: hypothetical protein UY95_C0030G0006 [Parcubacteria group bacterium GW2011_GWA2_56_7]
MGFFPFRDTAEYAALISSDLDAPDVEISSPFTGFSFAYCRDALEANNVTDDLPDLSVIQTPGSQSEDVFKELLFPVEGLPRPEALGVRVASNVHYEPPEVWFENQDFVGAPAPETLDGFSGVRDERTLYISAPNLPTDTLNSSKIYPNMYAVAYSEGATESTQNIYGQMLESWSFLGERNPVTNALTFTNNRLCTADLNGSPDVVEVSGVPVACSSDLDCADVLAFDESGTPLVVTCAANKDKLGGILSTILEMLRISAILLHPVLPETSLKMLAAINMPTRLNGHDTFSKIVGWGQLPSGKTLNQIPVLFPRLTPEQIL